MPNYMSLDEFERMLAGDFTGPQDIGQPMQQSSLRVIPLDAFESQVQAWDQQDRFGDWVQERTKAVGIGDLPLETVKKEYDTTFDKLPPLPLDKFQKFAEYNRLADALARAEIQATSGNRPDDATLYLSEVSGKPAEIPDPSFPWKKTTAGRAPYEAQVKELLSRVPDEDRDLFNAILNERSAEIGEMHVGTGKFGRAFSRSAEASNMALKKFFGDVNPFDASGKERDEYIRSQQIVAGASPVQGDTWLESGALGATEMLPDIIASLAVSAGGLAPSNAIAYWYARTQPDLELQMESAGVDEGTAKGVSYAAALPIALIERLQVKQLSGPAKSLIVKGLTRKAADLAKRGAVTYGTEWTEELLQTGIEVTANVVAQEMGGDGLSSDEWKKLLHDAKADMKKATEALPFLIAGGTAVGAAAQAADPQGRAEKAKQQFIEALSELDEKGTVAGVNPDNVRTWATENPDQAAELLGKMGETPSRSQAMPYFGTRSTTAEQRKWFGHFLRQAMTEPAAEAQPGQPPETMPEPFRNPAQTLSETRPHAPATSVAPESLSQQTDTGTPGQSPVAPQAPQETTAGVPPVGFRTSKGSTYTVSGESTQRTKSQHEGHEPTDVGLKEQSQRTVYVDPAGAEGVGGHITDIGGHLSLNRESQPKVELTPDGIRLTSRYGKGWSKIREKVFPYTTQPEVGLAPVEFFADGTVHLGNTITEVFSGTEAQQAPIADEGVSPRPLVGPTLNKAMVESALQSRMHPTEPSGRDIGASMREAGIRGWDYQTWARNFPKTNALLGPDGQDVWQAATGKSAEATPPPSAPLPPGTVETAPGAVPDLTRPSVEESAAAKEPVGGVEFREADDFTRRFSGELEAIGGREWAAAHEPVLSALRTNPQMTEAQIDELRPEPTGENAKDIEQRTIAVLDRAAAELTGQSVAPQEQPAPAAPYQRGQRIDLPSGQKADVLAFDETRQVLTVETDDGHQRQVPVAELSPSAPSSFERVQDMTRGQLTAEARRLGVKLSGATNVLRERVRQAMEKEGAAPATESTPETAEQLAAAAVANMKRPALQRMARNQGQPTTGTTDELRARVAQGLARGMSPAKLAAAQKRQTEETPMARRWREIKEANPGAVVLFRMGDFYETFNEDAEIASKTLGLTLTSRDKGSTNPIPMAGFPYHQLDAYIKKLVAAGHRVAVAEQVKPGAKVSGKGDDQFAKVPKEPADVPLTKAEREWAEWALDPMRDYWTTDAGFGDGTAESGEKAMDESALPSLNTGGLNVRHAPPQVIEDLLYRLEEQAADMAETEGHNPVSARRLAKKIRKALEAEQEPDDLSEQALAPSPRQHGIPRHAQPQPGTEALEPLNPESIIKQMERDFDVPIRVGRTKTPGVYKRGPEVVRLQGAFSDDFGFATHEVAHHLDKTIGLRPKNLPTVARQELKRLDYDQKQLRSSEGVAEFLRFYITDEPTARREAPNYYNWFEATFLADHPHISAKLKRLKELAIDWQTMGAMKRVGGKISESGQPARPVDETNIETMQGLIASWTERQRTEWKDPFYALQKLDRLAKELHYQTKTGESTAYALAQAFHMAAPQHAERAVQNGIHLVSETRDDILGKGLPEYLKDIQPEEYDEFRTFAYARFALELSNSRPGYNPGISPQDAKAVVSEVSKDRQKFQRYAAAHDGLTEFNNNAILMLADAGVITDEEARKIIGAYKHYIPLHRILDPRQVRRMEKRGGLIDVRSPLKRRTRKGSGAAIMDPVDATIKRVQQFYDVALKQQVKLQMYREADPQLGGAKGMGAFVEHVPPDAKPFQTTLGEVWPKVEKELEQAGLDPALLEDLDLDPTAVITLWRQDLRANDGRYIDRVVIDGKPRLYYLDPALYDALKEMSPVMHGPFMRVFAGFSNAVKLGAVGLNPVFAGSNLARDWQTFQENTKYSDNVNSATNPFVWIGRFINSEWIGRRNDVVQLYREMGGMLGTRFGVDRTSLRRQRHQIVSKGKQRARELALDAITHPLDTAANAVNRLRDAITVSDVGPRLAEFTGVLKSHGYQYDSKTGELVNVNTGKAERPPRHVLIDAINAANDVTINFKRRGRKSVYVERFFPFFSAAIEGMSKKTRVYTEAVTKPGTVRNRVAVVLMLKAAATTLYWLSRHDDDDYREEEDWLKWGYWTFTDSNGKPIVRIPKGYEESIFPNLVEGILESMSDEAESGLADALSETARKHLPIRDPGIAKAFLETAFNYDFFRGAPIESEAMQELKPEDRAKPYTTGLSKMLGQYTGKAFGVGPARLEHFLNQLVGGAYSKVLSGEHIDVRQAFTIRKDYPKSVDEFYDERGAMLQEQASAKQKKEALPPARADRLHVFERSAEVMSSLRKELLGIKEQDERFKLEKYVIGLSRMALDKPNLERYPNPFTADFRTLPEPVRKAVAEIIKTEANHLSDPRPLRTEYKSHQAWQEAIEKWEREKRLARVFLDKSGLRPDRVREVWRANTKLTGSDAQLGRIARLNALR